MVELQVIIQVSADEARAFHEGGAPSAKSRALLRNVRKFSLTLEPLHRATDDLTLQSYFVVEVPDWATAQRVMKRLGRLKAVQAAYVKPPDELAW